VTFHKAIQKLSKLCIEVGALVNLILDGKITPVAKGEGTGLAAMLFDAGEIELFSKSKAIERREGKHTMQETAKLLRTSNDEVSFLVTHGFLIGEKTARGRGIWCITQAEIDRFKATYSTVGQMTHFFCTSTRGLSDRLMANGIIPVTGTKLDGGCIYFFKRADLEAVDPLDALPKTNDSTLQKMNEQGLASTRQLADMTGYAAENIERIVEKGKIIPALTHRPQNGRNTWFFSQEQVEKFKKLKAEEEGQLALSFNEVQISDRAA